MDPELLSQRDMLFLPKRAAPSFHDAVLSSLRAAGVEPRRIREVKRLRSVFTLIACEVGFGVAPWSTTRTAVEGVTFREMDGLDVRIETHIFCRMDTDNPLVQPFVDVCEEAGRSYGMLQRAQREL